MSMDLELGRFELVSVGSTGHDCMQILPSNKGRKQKIVVGDGEGTLTCVGTKKGNSEVSWTVPSKSRKGVTGLCIGGPIDAPDKIYAAFGQTIQGIKKKGADFFKFDTSLNEDITHLYVEEMSIWTTGQYIMNMFESYNDTQFYMASDPINDFVLARIDNPEEYNIILGCQDSLIRVLKTATSTDAEDCVFQQAVSAPVMCIHMYREPGDEDDEDDEDIPADERGRHVLLYGTDDGKLGKLVMSGDRINKGFVMDDRGNKPGIKCIDSFDLTQDGVDDIVVGRDDGTLQVLSFEEGGDKPTQVFTREIGGSITSLKNGNMLGKQEDLLLSTYSGKCYAFTHEMKSNIAHIRPKKTVETSKGEEIVEAPNEANNEEGESAIFELQNEIERLADKLEKEKEKYTKLSGNHIAVDMQFKVKESFRLLPEEACYLLTVEINIPMDVVLIQSDVPVMLLDMEDSTAMLARTPPNSQERNELLASFRLQDGVTRLEVKVRTVEGQHGKISVYIMARQQPKTCQKVVFNIRPLSLHTKIHLDEAEQILKIRPTNVLKLSGNFTLNDIHSWVVQCLPSVVTRLSTDSAKLCFKSSFLGTILVCDYRAGEGIFSSDSVTVISILKEVISREATTKKIQIQIGLDLKDESVFTFLELLKPELDHHFSLARKHSLVEALKEIQMHEDNCEEFLSEELMGILNSSEALKSEVKNAPRHLDFLRGIVTDLFVDKHKLRGQRMEKKKPMLLQILDDYNYDTLVAAFRDQI